MDIPYTIEARPDTGLYNAKVGIWLFLASEVMLFGALFSAYILLRVSAPDWPYGWLNIPLGTANTLVLITSSITTVMAWASLKMHRFDRFKLFHACTLLLAMVFIGIKSYEYHDKFTHYEIDLKSMVNGNMFVDGHIHTSTYVDPAAKQSLVMHGYHGAEFTRPAPGPGAAERHYVLSSLVVEGRYAKDRHDLYDLHERKITHGEIKVDASRIKSMQSYGPWHNTYTAIYFTLTGLHALHVIGGAIVIGFLWGPGSKMWETDPERFTNRVEISGLFWHFVDLIWIFLFPVLYLL